MAKPTGFLEYQRVDNYSIKPQQRILNFDEFHQSFVAGRGPSVKDVGIDSIGVCAACLLYWTAAFFHRKHHTFVN